MLADHVLHHRDLFCDAIDGVLNRCPKKFRYCTLEVLKCDAEPIFCLIRGGTRGVKRNQLLNYGKFVLQRETFPGKELRSILGGFHLKKSIPTGNGEILFGHVYNAPQQRFIPSKSEYHDFPGCLYELGSTGTAAPGLHEPLVAKGLPPFFDVRDAVATWTKVPVVDNDGRYGRLLLFVPDFRARFERLTFDDETLRVNASFSKRGLSISVLASDGRKTVRKTARLRKRQSFALLPNPTSLRLFITNETGEIIDSFSEEERWTTRERVIFAGARYSEEVMGMIRQGETDVVEFKPFIRLDDKHKTGEIVKAVISFANTRGGTIFIGVSTGVHEAYSMPRRRTRVAALIERRELWLQI